MIEKSTNCWRTPPHIFEALCDLNGGALFDTDAAADRDNALCVDYLTRDDDALCHRSLPLWFGRVWCNPPYSHVRPWVDQAIAAVSSGYATSVVMLVNASTDTLWFSKAAQNANFMLFTRRIEFDPPAGVKASTPRYANVAFHFTPHSLGGGAAEHFGGFLCGRTGNFERSGTAARLGNVGTI